jgi:uncharacterized protein YtpQ (UPF0354 family)
VRLAFVLSSKRQKYRSALLSLRSWSNKRRLSMTLSLCRVFTASNISMEHPERHIEHIFHFLQRCYQKTLRKMNTAEKSRRIFPLIKQQSPTQKFTKKPRTVSLLHTFVLSIADLNIFVAFLPLTFHEMQRRPEFFTCQLPSLPAQ